MSDAQKVEVLRAALLAARDALDDAADRIVPAKLSDPLRDAATEADKVWIATSYRFAEVSCSQCGQGFGPGNSGFSHCGSHAHLEATS